MPDPFKAQLRDRNPLPDPPRPPALNASGERFARDGYTVLERADRSDPFNRNLRGLAPPVANDGPNVAWDEEK